MGPWAVPLLIVAVAAPHGPVRRRGTSSSPSDRALAPPRARREGPLGAPSLGGAGLAAGARPALPAWSAGTRRLTSADQQTLLNAPQGAHQCRVRASPSSRASTGLAIAAPAAQAHVTLNPRSVTANSFGRLDVRVPNERDEAGTKTVVLYFPHGFYSASDQARLGLDARRSRCASSPRRSRAPTATSPRRSRRSPGARPRRRDWIAPGQFEEFGLSMRIPNTPERDADLPAPARPTATARSSTGTAPRAPRRPRRRRERRSAPRAGRGRRRTRRSRASTPKRNSTQHKAVERRPRDVQGQDADRDHLRSPTSSGATVAAEVQRADVVQQGGHPRRCRRRR